MGATSVTGVGLGAADAGVKGPHNNRDYYVPLVGPHVVCSGRVTLVAGAATVYFPSALEGSQSLYNVMLTAVNVAVNASETVVVSMNDDVDGNFDNFVVAGTAAEVVMWMVVKNGFGV